MPLGIRGSNPIWTEFDLAGKIFDDTFYMYVLQNTIPYAPATVYHDPDLNGPWTSPIQFLGNGTLPVDIFFESEVVYRLEFRQNDGISMPSQADPLIYEVNNYVAGSGGSTPVDTVAFASSNQITNPQFSLINFTSPLSLVSVTDPAPIEIGPGWFLELAGTGSVTITQVPLNNSNANPSNAPYALRLTLTGWTTDSVVLRQRFQQNGMLWENKIVSSTITARIEGAPQSIAANLIDSNSSTLAQVLPLTVVNEAWNEFTGYGELPATTNPNTPPAAYIEYRLSLPSNSDIYVTSFQLVAQELPIEPSFEQDTIDRQIDHTFHYYKDSILIKPKDSILTGWSFALNPWQFYTTAATVDVTASKYIADQTIVSLQNPGSIQTLQDPNTGAFCLQAVTATTQQQWAITQYIDQYTIWPYWGSFLSSLVNASISNGGGGATATKLKFKMRLLYRSTVPAGVNPIATWNTIGTEPTYAAGWTAIKPLNDVEFTLSSITPDNFPFNSFQLPAGSSSTNYMAIVLINTSALSSATTDIVYFNRISLVPNIFAVDSNPETADQVLRKCQFYYEKSYDNRTLPGTASITNGLRQAPQTIFNATSVYAKTFSLDFNTNKRSTAPLVTMYDYAGTTNTVTAQIDNNNSSPGRTNGLAIEPGAGSNWNIGGLSSKTKLYVPANINAFITVGAAQNVPSGWIEFHYTVDARLGIVA